MKFLIMRVKQQGHFFGYASSLAIGMVMSVGQATALI